MVPEPDHRSLHQYNKATVMVPTNAVVGTQADCKAMPAIAALAAHDAKSILHLLEAAIYG